MGNVFYIKSQDFVSLLIEKNSHGKTFNLGAGNDRQTKVFCLSFYL